MRSINTVFLSLVALTSAVQYVAAADDVLRLARAIAAANERLSKRHDVDCGDGYFCLSGTYCTTGDNGLPACCLDGEICSGDGGVTTIVNTATVTVDHTSYLPDYTLTLTSTSTKTTTRTTVTTSTPTSTSTYTRNTTTTYTASLPILTLTTTFPPRNTTTAPSGSVNGTTLPPTVTLPTISPPPESEGAAGQLTVKVGFVAAAAGLLGLMLA